MSRLFLTLLGLFLLHTHAFADEPASLRVMSFNIRYGTARDGENHWEMRKQQVVDTIEEFNPDLLGLQETLAFQKSYLITKLSEYDWFGAGRDDGANEGEMVPIFYRRDRFEKLDGGHFWLSETPEVPGSKGWDTSITRMVTWLRLRDRKAAGQSEFVIANTHFDHIGKQAREKSAELLRDWIRQLEGDPLVILTGDFNSGEGSVPYQTVFATAEGETVLLDTFRVIHPERADAEGTANGFDPSRKSGVRIDWIACSSDFQVLDAGIDHSVFNGRTPSDHFPIWAVLKLQ